MALPKPIEQLVREVFIQYGSDAAEKARDDPETCLTSLLLAIKDELPREGGASLDFTVEKAAFRQRLEKAHQYLQEETKKQQA